MQEYNFQYCQKIIVLSKEMDKVLLCKRKGEADYDGTFSFIGGKMENTDPSILEGVKREKDEEVGEGFEIKLFPKFTFNVLFRKKDGNAMILPHYLSIYEDGEIELNEEYSEYKWVSLDDLAEFEPKIASIPDTLTEVLKLKEIIQEDDLILI